MGNEEHIVTLLFKCTSQIFLKSKVKTTVMQPRI